jgi:hypothetical protein
MEHLIHMKVAGNICTIGYIGGKNRSLEEKSIKM